MPKLKRGASKKKSVVRKAKVKNGLMKSIERLMKARKVTNRVAKK